MEARNKFKTKDHSNKLLKSLKFMIHQCTFKNFHLQITRQRYPYKLRVPYSPKIMISSVPALGIIQHCVHSLLGQQLFGILYNMARVL